MERACQVANNQLLLVSFLNAVSHASIYKREMAALFRGKHTFRFIPQCFIGISAANLIFAQNIRDNDN